MNEDVYHIFNHGYLCWVRMSDQALLIEDEDPTQYSAWTPPSDHYVEQQKATGIHVSSTDMSESSIMSLLSGGIAITDSMEDESKWDLDRLDRATLPISDIATILGRGGEVQLEHMQDCDEIESILAGYLARIERSRAIPHAPRPPDEDVQMLDGLCKMVRPIAHSLRRGTASSSGLHKLLEAMGSIPTNHLWTEEQKESPVLLNGATQSFEIGALKQLDGGRYAFT